MIVVFGSVLRRFSELGEEEFFIYLAEGRAGSYLAKILSSIETRWVEQQDRSPSQRARQVLKSYDYILLQTKEFLGRAAVFGRQAEAMGPYNTTSLGIDAGDLDLLKTEIANSPNAYEELKKAIGKLG